MKPMTVVETAKTFKNWFPILLGKYGMLGRGYMIYKLRNGLKLKARKKSIDYSIVNDIFLKREYEKCFEVEKGDIVIDIGAHIGAFSILAGSRGAYVYSFEPEKECYKLLRENIKLNSLNNKIKCFNLAVDSERGIDYLFLHRNLVGHSLFNKLIANSIVGKQKIKKITLEDVFISNKISVCNFLKLDCEGAEYDILSSSTKILNKIEKIAMEYHKVEELEAIKYILEKNGFEILLIKHGPHRGMIYSKKKELINLQNYKKYLNLNRHK
jgi:FkbM family methyltransferase